MSKLIVSAALLMLTAGVASAGEERNWISWQPGHGDDHPTFGGDQRQVMAPEIDPASSVAAMTLLVGGLVVLRGRKLRA
jgi:hypothetical protein